MKIKYEFVTGEAVEIEVDEALGGTIVEIERQEYNRNRKETRRHESYSTDDYRQEILVDKSADVEAEIQEILDKENTDRAVAQLQPQQQELVRKVFFEERPIVSVAKELGITKQACNNRLNKIYNQLKKYISG